MDRKRYKRKKICKVYVKFGSVSRPEGPSRAGHSQVRQQKALPSTQPLLSSTACTGLLSQGWPCREQHLPSTGKSTPHRRGFFPPNFSQSRLKKNHRVYRFVLISYVYRQTGHWRGKLNGFQSPRFGRSQLLLKPLRFRRLFLLGGDEPKYILHLPQSKEFQNRNRAVKLNF